MRDGLIGRPDQRRDAAEDAEIDDERKLQRPWRVLRQQAREQGGDAEADEVGAGADHGGAPLVTAADQLGQPGVPGATDNADAEAAENTRHAERRDAFGKQE